MCQIRLRVPAWVSCCVNTSKDILAAFMDVRAAITLMDMVTDSSSCADSEEGWRGQVLSLVCRVARKGRAETVPAYWCRFRPTPVLWHLQFSSFLVHFVCLSFSYGLPVCTFKPLYNSLFLGVRVSAELVKMLILIEDHEAFVHIHVHKQRNKQDTELVKGRGVANEREA